MSALDGIVAIFMMVTLAILYPFGLILDFLAPVWHWMSMHKGLCWIAAVLAWGCLLANRHDRISRW